MTQDLLGAAAAFLYVILFQLCGCAITAYLLRRETLPIRLLLGSVVGMVMLEWFPMLAAIFVDFTPAGHAAAGLLALSAAAWPAVKWRRSRRAAGLEAGPRHGQSGHHGRGFLVLIAAVWAFFCYLILHGFVMADGAVYSSQATYGDMAMHLSFVTSIARQGNFPPDYSILYGTRLSYPFLSDSVSASLYLLGAPLRFAYCLPAFFAAAQAMLGLYVFALRWLKDRAKAAVSWTFYFFNGGFGFLYAMEPGGLTALLNNYFETPTNDVANNIRWVNVLVDMMLPQRATLFGWAVLFPAMYLLYRAVFERETRYYLYAGVLFGALPMIHTHSLLFAAILCLTWMTAALFRTGRPQAWLRAGKCVLLAGGAVFAAVVSAAVAGEWKLGDAALYTGLAGIFLMLAAALWALVRYIRAGGLRPLFFRWGLLLLAVCVLALPQLFYWTFSQVGGEGFLRGYLNWANYEDNYFLFYLKNIGVVAVLLPFAVFFAKRRDFVRCLPAAACWFIAECICFQPNEYDNNKLLYPAYALICCLCAGFLVDLLRSIRRRPLRGLAGAVVLSAGMASAVLTMARETVASYELYSPAAVRVAEYADGALETDAVVLTGTRHNNEITGLAGRNIVCGSSIFLWFHGLDYQAAEDAVAAMYTDPMGNADLFRAYGVGYVLISDQERREYGANEELFASLWECIYNEDDIRLYRVM